MKFSELQESLRNELRRRIARQELSVSLISRKTGLAQSHVSNFLRGRSLSLASLDRLSDGLSLGVERLLAPPTEPLAVPVNPVKASFRQVPLVSHTTAIFEPVILQSLVERIVAVPAIALRGLLVPTEQERRAWDRFVAIELSANDVQGMEPLFRAGATVVLDRHYHSLQPYGAASRSASTSLPPGTLCAVRFADRLLLRFGEYSTGRIVLRPYASAMPLELVQTDSRAAANALVVGRVVFYATRM